MSQKEVRQDGTVTHYVNSPVEERENHKFHKKIKKKKL